MKKYKLLFIIIFVIAVLANIPLIGFLPSSSGFHSPNPHDIVDIFEPTSLELNPIFWLPVFIQNPQENNYYDMYKMMGLEKNKNVFARRGISGNHYHTPIFVYFDAVTNNIIKGIIYFSILIFYWLICALVITFAIGWIRNRKTKKNYK